MARVLLLSRYGRLGASSRVRSYAYLPHLGEAGIQVEVAPLFDDEYVARLYDGRGTSKPAVVRAYARRLARLVTARDFDVLWVEKELFPYLPAMLDRALAARFPRLVLDYDDAVFHRYDRHRLAPVRALFGRRIQRVMRAADAVVCGSPYLVEHARAAGARRVEEIPTVVDLERYRLAAASAPVPAPEAITIGWIGTPRTARYLEPYSDAFAAVARDTGARFRLIGAGPTALEGVPGVERPTWTEAAEAEDLAACDIGVMPLPDEPFERGKCAYKLVQMQALAKPVVASPVGMNADFVQHGANGLLAASPAEWREALTRLVRDGELRARLGSAGRARVEERYSLGAQAPRWVALLRELTGETAPVAPPVAALG